MNAKNLFILSLALLQTVADEKCRSQITKFYGFEGIEQSISYRAIQEDLARDFCPRISESCCTAEDFQKSNEGWVKASKQIKGFTLKMFKILQRLAISHGAMVKTYNSLSPEARQRKFCKHVDPSMFSIDMGFERMFFFLTNALETFSFIQKGFFCTLCDGRSHRFFKVNGDQSSVQIGRESCLNLIYFFKEYITYKVLYLDPQLINMNNMFNCVNTESQTLFKVKYGITFKKIQQCVLENINCEFLCLDFRLGASYSYFIGDMQEYERFIDKLEHNMKRQNFGEKVEEPEMDIDLANYSNEFFTDRDEEENNLSRIGVTISDTGIDLFRQSESSNYPFDDVSVVLNNLIDYVKVKQSEKIQQLQSSAALPTDGEVKMFESQSNSNDMSSVEHIHEALEELQIDIGLHDVTLSAKKEKGNWPILLTTGFLLVLFGL